MHCESELQHYVTYSFVFRLHQNYILCALNLSFLISFIDNPYRVVRCPFPIAASPSFMTFDSHFAQDAGFGMSVANRTPSFQVSSVLPGYLRFTAAFKDRPIFRRAQLLKPTFTRSPRSTLTHLVVLRTPTLLPVMLPYSQLFLSCINHTPSPLLLSPCPLPS